MSAIYRDTHGRSVASDDKNRLMWYSAKCSYYTDDWSKLDKVGPGIPVCPKCKSVGFQSRWDRWETGAIRHDMDNPGYCTFLQDVKERCYGVGVGISAVFTAYQRDGRNALDGEVKKLIESHVDVGREG